MSQSCELHVGLAFTGRKRPGFDQEYAARVEQQVRTLLQGLPVRVTEADRKLIDEQSACAVLDRFAAAGVQVPIFLQCTMGDGRLVPTIAARWGSPVVLWATPENPEGSMISSCSLVGTHNWASILINSGVRPAVVYGDPVFAGTTDSLLIAIRACAAARGLRQTRLGVIGGAAPGFIAMEVDPFELNEALGVQHQALSLADFRAVYDEVAQPDIDADLAVTATLELPLKEMEPADLAVQSRFYCALKHYFAQEQFDAVALRCWPELPNQYGQWPYLAMTRLAEEGYAVSMEGDSYGAVGSWLAEALGMGPCYISDWLAHDEDTITLWHAGNLPFALSPSIGSPGSPVVTRHFNVRKPAVVESVLRPGMDVTLFRIWRGSGGVKMAVMEGASVEPRRPLMGTNGLVAVQDTNVNDFFIELVRDGMPHHISLCEGHHANRLKTVADLLRITVQSAR